MKDLKFYVLMMSMFVCMASVSSCSDDDDKKSGSAESGDVTSFNQVRFFEDNIVELDSLGNLVQRVNGAMLNSGDTTELAVGVADFAAADSTFRSWLSPDTQVSPLSGSSTDLQASLKDSTGAVKNIVYFKKIDEPGQTLAEITFANEDDAFNSKFCSKIVFQKSKAWPLNEKYSPYDEGAIETTGTAHEGDQKWVCIRPAAQGVSGLMVYISQQRDTYGILRAKNFASPSLAKTAADIIKANWDSFAEMFKAADRTIEKGTYYWINDWKYFVFGGGIYAVRLSDSDIDWFDIVYRKPDKPYIQVRTFGLVGTDD
jgi:hypothetical protein